MQMHADNQRFLTGHEVAVFDATGAELIAFTFTGPVENGANQSHVLLATAQAETEFEVTADQATTPVIPSGGGMVCFRQADGTPIDCAAWGNYSGEDTGTGTPFNSPLGLVPDQSMERRIDGGSDPQALDAEDDTDNSEGDFDFGEPSPTNNAGDGSEPGPEPAEHERSVTLKLSGGLVARGKVTAEDGFEGCFSQVAVRVQRRANGKWRTVKRASTDEQGSYRATMRDKPGRYRATAPETEPSDDHRCLKATSKARRNL
jgi:hypothetical protein